MDLCYAKPFGIEVLVSIVHETMKKNSAKSLLPVTLSGGTGGVGGSGNAVGAKAVVAASARAPVAVAAPARDAAAAVAPAALGASASDLLKVLIVEDSLPIMKAMTMNLRRAKHTVEQAVNGLIGLEYMKQKEFDVVVMDLQVSVSVDAVGGLLCALVCRRNKCESGNVLRL